MSTSGAAPNIDPELVDIVDHVRNRYGAHGLRQLIELAGKQAEITEDALSELAEAT
jgi:hypothetical protein